MPDPRRNAAIWYATDAFDPDKKGLNGRRVAGESFLRGFLKYVDADCIQGLVGGVGAGREFKSVVSDHLQGRRLETYYLYERRNHPKVRNVFYPSPNYGTEAWRRFHFGQKTYTITGITHTTATKGVMNGIFDLLASPVEPWDGLICTSTSVLQHMQYQFDLFAEYAARKFGAAPKTVPQLAKIPLGIHTEDFQPTPADRAALRDELDIGDDDVAFMVLSRLSAHEKFDPLPVYRALALAQRDTGKTVHMILCGYFPDTVSEGVFRDGAKSAMPNVKLHVVDGKNAAKRMQAFGAADVFLFPIDNIQETFGIAPIEAMAAGLPVIGSDWDGLKDTISPDVGFRVPTHMPGPALLQDESYRYQNDHDKYMHYTLLTASMTQLDVPYMAKCMARLIKNPNLRRKMGDAGRVRAKQHYDWSVVIPQMQDFWADLDDRRISAESSLNKKYHGMDVPPSPNVARLFKSYPTHQGGLNDIALSPGAGATADALDYALKNRNFEKMGRVVEHNNTMHAVLAEYLKQGAGATVRSVAAALGKSLNPVARCTYFFLKYDLLQKMD
ncbi:MAG: glycosyltransferase family 4 protein [Pseudomonadota bacterium]